MGAVATVLQPLAALGAPRPGGQELGGLKQEAAGACGLPGGKETACKDPRGHAQVQGAGQQLGGCGTAATSADGAPPQRQAGPAQDVQQPPAPGEPPLACICVAGPTAPCTCNRAGSDARQPQPASAGSPAPLNPTLPSCPSQACKRWWRCQAASRTS